MSNPAFPGYRDGDLIMLNASVPVVPDGAAPGAEPAESWWRIAGGDGTWRPMSEWPPGDGEWGHSEGWKDVDLSTPDPS